MVIFINSTTLRILSAIHLPDPPGGGSEQVYLVLAASVRRVDHRDPPPQLRRPRVAARLLVHRVQPRLHLKYGYLFSDTLLLPL